MIQSSGISPLTWWINLLSLQPQTHVTPIQVVITGCPPAARPHKDQHIYGRQFYLRVMKALHNTGRISVFQNSVEQVLCPEDASMERLNSG